MWTVSIKNAELGMLTSNITDFKTRTITRDEEGNTKIFTVYV